MFYDFSFYIKMNKFKSYKASNSKKSKKKIWKYILCIILILLIVLCIYSRPYKEIHYYWEDDILTDKISDIKIKCPRRYPTIIRRIFSCWDYTSYYRNWNKSYHSSFDGKHEKYIDYFENWQKRVECSFEETPFVVNGNQLNRYQHSVEPCIFYDENGQIQKSYIEWQIEKDFDLSPKNEYWSWTALQFSRLRYYNESWNVEKVEYYLVSSPFGHLYEKDTRTPEGKEKEYYLFNWDLGQIEYYDKEWKLISTKLYETIEYNSFYGRYISRTFYNEDGNMKKIEIYDDNWELSRIEEYDNEWNIIHIERF